MNRVVITGMGVVAPNGIGLKEYWDSLIKGISKVSKIESFDVSEYSTKIAGEVKNFVPTKYIDYKKAKRMARFSQFALYAAKMAKEDAKLEINEDNNRKIGVAIGVSVNGIHSIEEQESVLLRKGPNSLSPFLVQSALPNGATGNICVELNIKGRSITISTGCSSGLNAIGYAFECIKYGKFDLMFAGGAESPITPLVLGGFCASRALSRRNDEPEKASRPFDKYRDGYVLSEGAGILVLESIDNAIRRNARIYAEIIGYGTSTDAYSMFKVEPSGEEAVKCFVSACKEAELEPEDIDYINAHGSSSIISDMRETWVIKKALGEYSRKVMVSSIKSMIGHPLGASGALQTIASVMAINEGIVPPTINYEEKDSNCDLDYVPNEARREKVNVAVINSLGMGGNNATLVIKSCNN
jgi:3-oxoacyl-[acyl-carrier-protein] synthase II